MRARRKPTCHTRIKKKQTSGETVTHYTDTATRINSQTLHSTPQTGQSIRVHSHEACAYELKRTDSVKHARTSETNLTYTREKETDFRRDTLHSTAQTG